MPELKSRVIYLAAPYSDYDPQVVEDRMKSVRFALASYASQGHSIFTPLLTHHCLNEGIEMPTDFKFWENYCLSLLRKSDILLVLCLDGWDRSNGVLSEIEEAQKLKIPIIYTNQTIKQSNNQTTQNELTS